MRALTACTLLALVLATPGCLQAAVDAAGSAEATAGEPLQQGILPVPDRVEGFREDSVVPLWVGVNGARIHPDGAEQFRFNATPGYHSVVVEARWTPAEPALVNAKLKLLFLGPDRAILGQVEGVSPLRIVVPASLAPPEGPHISYAVGAESSVGVTKDQPYELAVSYLHGEIPPEAYTAFA